MILLLRSERVGPGSGSARAAFNARSATQNGTWSILCGTHHRRSLGYVPQHIRDASNVVSQLPGSAGTCSDLLSFDSHLATPKCHSRDLMALIWL